MLEMSKVICYWEMMLAPKSMCSVPGSFIENEALLICIIYIQEKVHQNSPRSTFSSLTFVLLCLQQELKVEKGDVGLCVHLLQKPGRWDGDGYLRPDQFLDHTVYE